jgi:hypothetical protein
MKLIDAAAISRLFQRGSSQEFICVRIQKNCNGMDAPIFLGQWPLDDLPLTGAQLVTAKVVEIVIMGGDYPTGSGEFNFAGDPASAAYVFANSPVAITGTGASLGASITVRQPSASNGATDPFSYALSLEGAADTGGYDPLAVHYAVMGLQDNYTVTGAGGVNTVNSSNGDNSWSATSGKASYLGKLLGDRQLANVYNAMVTRATLKQVPGNTDRNRRAGTFKAAISGSSLCSEAARGIPK